MPVMNTRVTWMKMKNRNQHSTTEMNRSGSLPIENLREPAELVGDRRTLHQAGDHCQRGGNENGEEISELL